MFTLMHGERNQKRKGKKTTQKEYYKNIYYAKYKKVRVLPLYGIQGLTF